MELAKQQEDIKKALDTAFSLVAKSPIKKTKEGAQGPIAMTPENTAALQRLKDFLDFENAQEDEKGDDNT